jgi:hypothetical protein
LDFCDRTELPSRNPIPDPLWDDREKAKPSGKKFYIRSSQQSDTIRV